MPSYIRNRLAPDAAVEAVETVVGHAAELTRQWRLLPPAEAAFLREHHLQVSDLDAVRALSSWLLQSVLDRANIPEEETPNNDRRTAFYYAAALLKQERVLRAFAAARSDAPTLDGALSDMDRVRVEDYLLGRSMSGPVSTLARLMSVWRRLVEQIEGHHDMGYEDYEQGLVARDYLEELVSLLSPDARTGLDAQVRPLDERFAAGTRSLATSIRPPTSWRPQRWWWFRVPRPMGESFQARLEHVAPAAMQEAAHKDSTSQRGRESPS